MYLNRRRRRVTRWCSCHTLTEPRPQKGAPPQEAGGRRRTGPVRGRAGGLTGWVPAALVAEASATGTTGKEA